MNGAESDLKRGDFLSNGDQHPDQDELSGSSESYDEADCSWIPWFCSLKGNEFFSEVDDSYIADAFNLVGLEKSVEYYEEALDLILDHDVHEEMNEEEHDKAENDAEILYGLIHARFVLTSRGLSAMHHKFRQSHFGTCPRVLCKGHALLPVGLSDRPQTDTVKLYCGRCEELYTPKSTRHAHIDGAYFGTTFPHLFYLTYPELKAKKPEAVYEPRVFGFRIHKDAWSTALMDKARHLRAEKGSCETYDI